MGAALTAAVAGALARAGEALGRLAARLAPGRPPAGAVMDGSPPGPPAHWLAVVRERAPRLLDGGGLGGSTPEPARPASASYPSGPPPPPSWPDLGRGPYALAPGSRVRTGAAPERPSREARPRPGTIARPSRHGLAGRPRPGAADPVRLLPKRARAAAAVSAGVTGRSWVAPMTRPVPAERLFSRQARARAAWAWERARALAGAREVPAVAPRRPLTGSAAARRRGAGPSGGATDAGPEPASRSRDLGPQGRPDPGDSPPGPGPKHRAEPRVPSPAGQASVAVTSKSGPWTSRWVEDVPVPSGPGPGGAGLFDRETTVRERWPALPTDPGPAVPDAVALWSHADRLDAEQRLR